MADANMNNIAQNNLILPAPPPMSMQELEEGLRDIQSRLERIELKVEENTQCLLFRRIRLTLPENEKGLQYEYKPTPIGNLVTIPKDIPHNIQPGQRDPRITPSVERKKRVSNKRRRRHYERKECDGYKAELDEEPHEKHDNTEEKENKPSTSRETQQDGEEEMTDMDFDTWLETFNNIL